MKMIALISIILIVGCGENLPKTSNYRKIEQLQNMVKQLEKIATVNAEITGINTNNITSLVKDVAELIRQIKVILDMILESVSCNPVSSLIY